MTRFQGLYGSSTLLVAASLLSLGMMWGCNSDNGETPAKCGDSVDLTKLIYDVNDASPEALQIRDELAARGCLTDPGDATSGVAGATGTGGTGGTGGSGGSPADSGSD